MIWMALRWCSILWGKVDMAFAGLFPTQWQLKGGCQKSGECCKFIVLELPRRTRLGLLHRFFTHWGRWWNVHVNGFTYTGILEDRFLGFTCNRLAADHTCMDYKNRPRVCREYPFVSYFGKPRLAKGCGFYLTLRPKKSKLYLK